MSGTLSWSSEYSLGIEEIDDEHMKWVAYINALHVGIEQGQDRGVLGQLLDDVISFSSEHFEHEEALFEGTDYPDKENHKKLHKDYIEELKTLKEKLSADGGPVLTHSVLASLIEWFLDHVQDVDRNYVPYLKSKDEAG